MVSGCPRTPLIDRDGFPKVPQREFSLAEKQEGGNSHTLPLHF
jgi:hypothetical protein